MESNVLEITLKGRRVRVPATRYKDWAIIVLGQWIRIASVRDEIWLEGEVVTDPEEFVRKIKADHLKADIFTFTQKISETKPKYRYTMEWDNFAAIPITNYREWWEKRVSRKNRQDVNRAERCGVQVKVCELSDALIRDIVALYNDIPIKQGRPFAHYGKDFDAIKREVSTFPERSVFITAHYETELIGFIKLVYIDEVASMLHIVSKAEHYNKRPANALVAKAVSVACESKKKYLLYGKYIYGNKTNSSLTEFKRRNGFEKILIPRFYIPLTLKGRIALRLKLHLGLIGVLPENVISMLLGLRSLLFRLFSPTLRSENQELDA